MDIFNSIKDKILQLIRSEFQRNYTSGVPRVPPHTHNGIDNLPVANVVNQIVAGTNVTITPTSGTGTVTITASSGGGGSPGGSNTQVQFNDSSAFGGDSAFTWTKTTNILTLDDGSESGSGGATISGGNSGLQIITEDSTVDDFFTGNINLTCGDSTGATGTGGSVLVNAGNTDSGDGGAIELTSGSGVTGNGGRVYITAGNAGPEATAGSVTIVAGNSGDISTAGLLAGGDVVISAGNTGEDVGGSVTIKSGAATTSGNGGNIYARLGATDSGNPGYFQITQSSAGSVQPNVAIGNSTSFAGGQGVVYIRNRTTAPSGSPSSGGVLYVESGALHWLGSSGTDTTIAPA